MTNSTYERTIMTHKTCFDSKGRGCGRTLPVETGFHRNNKARDGRATLCKECRCEQARDWRAENPETVSRMNRSWNRRNKARVAELNRAYYDANGDELREDARRHYHAKRPIILGKKRLYRLRNLEQVRERGREWWAANKDEANARRRQAWAEKRAAEADE
jgi:hypothetical protein